MPWTGPSFRDRHAHSLSSEEAAHAARIANAILKRSPGKEGMAIATGIDRAKARADGGSTDDPSQNIYNPMNQGMIQRYAAMPEEKLQELSTQLGGSPQSAIVQRVLAQKRMKGDQDTAAQNIKAPTAGTQPPVGYAGGGMPTMSMSQAEPPWTRTEWSQSQRQPSGGFLHGTTPGRADSVKTTAPGGAMVIPAEVVAHRGQGNSIAGAANIAALVKQGPYGAGMPGAVRPRGLPKAPPPFHETGGYVEKAMKWGGDVPLYRAGKVPGHGETRVDLSDGEFVVLPHDVAKFGGGDHAKGVKWWERWIMREHMAHIASLKKYKGPVKAGEDE